MTGQRMRLLAAAIAISLLAAAPAAAQDKSDIDTPEEAAQLTDAVRDDLFELIMSTPKATWAADERVEITATAAYVGEEPEMTVTGCWGAGPVWWGGEQLDGPDHFSHRASDFDLSRDCYDPVTGDVLSVTFTQFMHGPEWPFWSAALEPLLSPGNWRIHTLIRYGEAGAPAEHELVAELRIQVADDTDLPQTD